MNVLDLIPNMEIIEDELSNIVGGSSPKQIIDEDDFKLNDGCYSGICSVKINTSYCDGGAVCTCGIAGKE